MFQFLVDMLNHLLSFQIIWSFNMICFLQASLASVDVIPLFLEAAGDVQIDDDDLMISVSGGDMRGPPEPAVSIQHIPTCISFQSSGIKLLFGNSLL